MLIKCGIELTIFFNLLDMGSGGHLSSPIYSPNPLPHYSFIPPPFSYTNSIIIDLT